MKRTLGMLTTGAAIALASTTASAQTPRLSVSFDIGANVAVTGDVHGGGTGSVLTLPTTVESRSYGDIYGAQTDWALGLGVLTGPSGEVRVRVFRTTGSADRVQVGDVATLPLFAQFDDYKATGVDFGYRQYYGAETGARPFAGASIGFLRVDAIDAEFTVPAAAVTLSNVPMYDKSTVATFSLSGGVQYLFTPNVGLQGGIDFRWHGNLDPIDGLAGTGLESINDKSRRWSLPVTVGAVVRF
ncbi:MAG: hypothetical protein R2752_17435 [Vicinamibacterales bacterium]